MVLADTSVWIQHFRWGNSHLADLLSENALVMHPIVIGELATGNLRRRSETLHLLQVLPQAKVATFAECLELITTHHLFGRGIGWIDVNLLASALLAQAPLWSLDRTLREAAAKLGVEYEEINGD